MVCIYLIQVVVDFTILKILEEFKATLGFCQKQKRTYTIKLKIS